MNMRITSNITFHYPEEEQSELIVYVSKKNIKPSEKSHEIKIHNPQTIPIKYIKDHKLLYLCLFTSRICFVRVKYELGVVAQSKFQREESSLEFINNYIPDERINFVKIRKLK